MGSDSDLESRREQLQPASDRGTYSPPLRPSSALSERAGDSALAASTSESGREQSPLEENPLLSRHRRRLGSGGALSQSTADLVGMKEGRKVLETRPRSASRLTAVEFWISQGLDKA